MGNSTVKEYYLSVLEEVPRVRQTELHQSQALRALFSISNNLLEE
jgi:hypothetical protein